ncbi:unnamed protein product [Gadus morhua 'NCC']
MYMVNRCQVYHILQQHLAHQPSHRPFINIVAEQPNSKLTQLATSPAPSRTCSVFRDRRHHHNPNNVSLVDCSSLEIFYSTIV